MRKNYGETAANWWAEKFVTKNIIALSNKKIKFRL
mgnify:CR=1 FL=1